MTEMLRSTAVILDADRRQLAADGGHLEFCSQIAERAKQTSRAHLDYGVWFCSMPHEIVIDLLDQILC